MIQLLEKIINDLIVNFEWIKWGAAYLVLVVPVLVSWIWKLGIHRELMGVSLRAGLQLVLIALILTPVFLAPLWVQLCMIGVMTVIGSFIAAERGSKLPGSRLIAFISIFTGFTVIIGLFYGSRSLELDSRVLIPISGMLIGNAVNSVSLVFHKVQTDFEEYQSVMEAMLIDGADMKTVIRIPARITLTNALVPKVDSLKTLGIVHIPGAMAGLMVAGASPLKAAGYQLLIFFGIVSVSTLATLVSNELCYRKLFYRSYPHLK